MRLTIFIRSILLVLVLADIASVTLAQERCGTVIYSKNMQGEKYQQNKLHFEEWMHDKLLPKKRRDAERQQAAYEIPVVVHVIHDGDAIGVKAISPMHRYSPRFQY